MISKEERTEFRVGCRIGEKKGVRENVSGHWLEKLRRMVAEERVESQGIAVEGSFREGGD